MATPLTDRILQYLSHTESVDSLQLAKEFEEDHQKIVGAIKSLQSLEIVFEAEAKSETRVELSSEGKEVVAKGSHEALVFSAVPKGGGVPYYTGIMEVLITQLQKILVAGSPQEGKQAVRRLHATMNESERNHTFGKVVEALRANLVPTNTNYRTAIVALGHIALLMPEEFKMDMKAIVAQKIVKDLLLNPMRCHEDKFKNADNWCDEEDLPEITRCMMAGMKAIVRWVMGLKADLKAATITFKMLAAFVETGGGFTNAIVPFSNAETAWLRLTAGCCMLKICEHKGGNQLTASQFCALSKLMNDDVLEVRSQFATKLHRCLVQGIPYKCLPLDFMAFYSLAGYETDKKQKQIVKDYMVADIEHRREFITTMMTASERARAAEQLPHIMPYYMLVFSVPVLTHNPRFTSYLDTRELEEIKECLWFILKPLIVRNDSYSFGFYKTLVERMKNHKDALDVENEETQCKMYAVCDIALGLILQRSTSFEMNDYPSEPRVPPMYFKRHDDPFFSNTRSYLPADMQYSAPKKSGVTVSVAWGSANPNKRSQKKLKREPVVMDEHGNVSIDAQPNDASETRLKIPGIRSGDSDEEEVSQPVQRNARNSNRVSESTPEGSKPRQIVPFKSQSIVPDLEVASLKMQLISGDLSGESDAEEELEARASPVSNNTSSLNDKVHDVPKVVPIEKVTVETRTVPETSGDSDEGLKEEQEARVRSTRTKAVVSKADTTSPPPKPVTPTNVSVLKATRKRLNSSSDLGPLRQTRKLQL